MVKTKRCQLNFDQVKNIILNISKKLFPITVNYGNKALQKFWLQLDKRTSVCKICSTNEWLIRRCKHAWKKLKKETQVGFHSKISRKTLLRPAPSTFHTKKGALSSVIQGLFTRPGITQNIIFLQILVLISSYSQGFVVIQ